MEKIIKNGSSERLDISVFVYFKVLRKIKSIVDSISTFGY